MAGNFVHNDANPNATVGREDRPWYAMYADNIYATDVHGDIEGTTGINDDIQDALDLKAPLASPELTGTPKAPTAATGTTSTQLATTAFVANAIASGGGTGTRALFSGQMSAVPTQSLTGFNTWVNQGNAVVADTDAGFTLKNETANTSDSVNMVVKTAPSSPYTITVLISMTTQMANYPAAGIGWRNSSTGKFHIIKIGISSGGTGITVQGWSSTTVKEVTSASIVTWCLRVWLRIKDDGTNVYFYWSLDGSNFYLLYSVAKSSGYLGASGYNQISYNINAYNSKVYATLESYTEI